MRSAPGRAEGPKAHALLASLSSTAAFVSGLLDLILPVLGSLLVLLSRAKTQAVKCAPEDLFVVGRPTAEDAAELQELYARDYVEHHRQMQTGAAGRATCSEWEDALGKLDFESLLGDLKDEGAGDVRLLTCADRGPSGRLVGYILYELRAKGSPGRRRQRYCELVNIVVSKDRQGYGAGRLLFSELQRDLAATARSKEADDLRLFVAEGNLGPLTWYRRLGFQDAGWQTETLNDAQVRFQRMILRSA